MIDEGTAPAPAAAFVDELASALARDPAAEHGSGRDRALLRFAAKLTRTPAEMQAEDVSPLREHGLDDGEILDLVHVVGYYAYANRIADGLGLEIEPYRRKG